MNVTVIPAYDEAANVPRLLDSLRAHPMLWQGGRVLLVDDGSADDTADVAEAHAGGLPLEVLRQPTNQGPGRAFDRGFRRALELCGPDDLVVTLEADTTSDLGALDAMLALARTDADVVLASVHGGGALLNVSRRRVATSRMASAVVRRTAGLDARTVSSFFRVYRAAALRRAYDHHGDGLIREPGFACKAEILVKLDRLGARVAEVPVDVDAALRQGESKLRTLPTIQGYARLLLRDAFSGRRAA